MKNNKLSSISLICFMVLFAFTGCANKSEIINLDDTKVVTQSETWRDSLNGTDKSVTIACTDWAPYEYEEHGKIKGLGVDVVTEAFRRMGYKVYKEILPFSRAIEMLRNGEIDVITDVKRTEEREQFGIFPKEPIITTYTSLFVKSDSNIKFDGDILDLRNYKIGIVRDYTYGKEFDEAVKAKVLNVEAVDNNIQNINKVLDNRLDILIENRLVELAALKATNNENNLKEVKPELNQTGIYAWFSKKKDSLQMVDEFNNKLIEIKKDGTFKKIYDYYIN